MSLKRARVPLSWPWPRDSGSHRQPRPRSPHRRVPARSPQARSPRRLPACPSSARRTVAPDAPTSRNPAAISPPPRAPSSTWWVCSAPALRSRRKRRPGGGPCMARAPTGSAGDSLPGARTTPSPVTRPSPARTRPLLSATSASARGTARLLHCAHVDIGGSGLLHVRARGHLRRLHLALALATEGRLTGRADRRRSPRGRSERTSLVQSTAERFSST